MKRISQGLAVLGAALSLASPAFAQWDSSLPAIENGSNPHTAVAVENPASCALDGDKMLIVGGKNVAGAVTGRAFIFDKSGTPSWVETGSLPGGAVRIKGKMVPIGNNECLYISGSTDGTDANLQTTVYKFASGAWTSVTNLQNERRDFQVVPLTPGSTTKFVILGGVDSTGATLGTAELLSLSGTWSSAYLNSGSDVITDERFEFQMIYENDSGNSQSDFYVMGGDTGGGATPSVERINLSASTGAYSSTDNLNDLNVARKSFVAFPVSMTRTIDSGSRNLKILVAGGEDGGALSSVEVFDGTTWYDTDTFPGDIADLALTTARARLKACTNSAGDVIVVGGLDAALDDTVASSQKWDDSADAWENNLGTPIVEAMTDGRVAFALECLDDDSAYVAGGQKYTNPSTIVVLSSTEGSP